MISIVTMFLLVVAALLGVIGGLAGLSLTPAVLVLAVAALYEILRQWYMALGPKEPPVGYQKREGDQ
ncbi:TPA: hypothetical protein ACGW3M_000978 [Pseudomonas aeruginosa]|uniref:hypothetical protein n=1 Tax=Pseudomonas aeruginosa TaxID=287 RepID=UPI0027FEB687|nr:hypothetical protein [Pseudomonas aeruginosa]EKY4113682.1 hypothetical protein [Pseudomonas aeruginosa]ELJ2276204.1 hypothetical protein [Pseudomonas aeruginosa]MBX6653721.1 hypothetical protein [Pseudomonas aeruginosa]HCH7782776.1 hypothetical protein [Pseudomonas aeruginosa]